MSVEPNRDLRVELDDLIRVRTTVTTGGDNFELLDSDRRADLVDDILVWLSRLWGDGHPSP